MTLTRRWPVVSVALVLALTAGLLTHVPAVSAEPGQSPGSSSRKSVPVGKVKPRAPKKSTSDGRGITSVKHTTLPGGGSATVAVSGRTVRVGSLPITLTLPSPVSVEDEQRAMRRAQPASVRVRVLDQKRTKAAGAAGVLLELSRGDGQVQPGRVGLRVDYSAFANAFGADYAGRLRLRELPACALTTPDEAKCRIGRDLGAVNAGRALSAELTVAGGTAATVVAVTAAASGPGGTFEVTSLRQAYSWSAGDAGGSFSYSYPIQVPPAGVGPQPNLALTYDSGVVDGRTLAQNGQTSWVGEGWDLQVGYIERSYRPCSQTDIDPLLVGDLCWFSPNNATMLFGGRSASLVRDEATGVWRSASDDGLKIEHLKDASLNNGDNDGEHWKVTTQDGTQYFFGLNKRYANDNENTNSVQTIGVVGGDAQNPCASFCRQGYRWNLDYVKDPRRNTMTYVYKRFEGAYNSGKVGHYTYDVAANLDYIDYGDQAESEHSKPAPMRVQFETANRCIGTCTDTEYSKYPDTPWDQYCATDATTCTNSSPTFFNNKKLYAISAMVWDPVVPPKYRTIDRWVLNHTYPDPGDHIAPAGPDTSPDLWLASIDHTGYGADDTSLSDPPMEFGGEPLANRVGWGADIGVPPYMHYRLTSVRTGTGSETIANYINVLDDGRLCERAWSPTVDANPHLCFPQKHQPNDKQQDAGFGWFYKYLVRTVQEHDLTGGSPGEVTFYDYSNKDSSDSALWFHDNNETVLLENRTWSLWRGLSTVTASKEAADGSKTVNRNVHHRGMDGDGKTSSDGTGVAWHSRRVGLLAPVDTPGVDAAISGQGGRCLDVASSGTVDGTVVRLWTCNSSGAQVWDRQANGTLKNENSGKCLDIVGGATTNGAGVQIWTCRGVGAQIWQPQPDGSLRNPQSNRCLDLSNWGTASGTKVQLWDCSPDWNQIWQPQPDRSLMNPQPNRCIDVQNSGTVSGTKVQSRLCNDAGNQLWRLQSDGSFRNPLSDKCMDIVGGGTVNGTQVQIWTCRGVAAQIWQLQPDGSLKNPQSGRCLDAGLGAGSSVRGILTIFDCNASLTQKWSNRFLDASALQGVVRESQDLDGTQIASSTIHVPTVVQKATRAAPAAGGQEMRAYRVRETTTKARTWIAADSKWRWTEGQAAYDAEYGLPTDTRDLGDIAVTGDDTCTRSEYARNSTTHMVGFPSQVTEYAGTCGSATILTRSQVFYDNTTILHTPPSEGLTTRSQSLIAAAAGTDPDVWAVTQAAYDVRGRPTSNTDARGQITATAYTPSVDLPLKTVKVNNPLQHSATTTLDPGRGQPTQLLDTNNKITTIEYDPLGRRSAVWLPSEKKVNGEPASQTFAYDIRADAPNKLTTRVLQTKGTTPVYLASYRFLDGRMRVRNTQTPGVGGIGRFVTETRYDNRGMTASQTAPFYNANAAGSAMTDTAAANVPSQSTYRYDNLGRTKTEALQAAGVQKWSTTHSYDGDRHTVTPPSGGISTTLYDAAARPVKLTVHPTPSNPQSTTYAYDTAGNISTVTDPAGNITRYTYNLAGARTSTQDPDAGTSTSTYNPIGDLLTTTDARGQKLSYQYDIIGRTTARWSGEHTTGTLLASYTYDGKAGATGQLSKTIRHSGSNQYIVEPVGYDERYRPTGVQWTIPNVEGRLAGTYATAYGYDAADHLTTVTYPARAGLPVETVTTAYDTAGYPTTLEGVQRYITATGYSDAAQIASRTYGDPGAGQLIRNYNWDPGTGRLAGISATLPDPALPGTRSTIQDDRYNYQPAGDISSIKDHTDGQSQCYRYDGVHRLTEAFTATDDCAADPTNVAATGKHPYWDSYAFDNAGRRTTDTHRTATTITNRTYTYPTAGQPRPHAMTSVAVTGATTRTDTYGYDPAGNLNTRTVAGITSTYTINAEGRFDTATVAATGGPEQTRHLYDADGTPLIRTDPTGSTLILGAEELKAVGNNTTGTRYYQHAGATVATRTGSNLAWLAADHQASANLTVNPTTATIQRRWYTPYGADRTQPTTWPTDRGFLNAKTNTSTTLIDVGAREYDPDTGTFTAPDPLVDLTNPNSFNPYAYAHHNPITLSDPTGLAPISGDYGGNSQPSHDEIQADRAVAAVLVIGAAFIAILVCAGTAGLGCAIMAGIAVGAAIGAATAKDGQRSRGAIIGGIAGAVGGAVGGLLAGSAGIVAASTGRLIVAGAAAGATENATDQYLSTGTIDWRQTMLAGALGGALGPAGKIAVKLAGKLRGVKCHSFAPTTAVLMADGSTKPIKDITIGDQVTATDPDTGKTEPKPVEQLHNNHDTDLTDLTIRIDQDAADSNNSGDDTTTVLHTTQHHPFWDHTAGQWVDAADLTPGHQLRTTNGNTATITTVHNHTRAQTMRDLTVADIHTYYVLAGTTPVLVHNCGPGVATEDDAMLALGRAEELQASRNDYFMADVKGTTAVIGVFNSKTKAFTNRIGINGGGTMPSGWTLRPGEEFVQAAGHAEEGILNSLGPNEHAVFGAASRNFCVSICLPMLDTRGIRVGGAGIRGHDAQNSPFTIFWATGG